MAGDRGKDDACDTMRRNRGISLRVGGAVAWGIVGMVEFRLRRNKSGRPPSRATTNAICTARVEQNFSAMQKGKREKREKLFVDREGKISNTAQGWEKNV